MHNIPNALIVFRWCQVCLWRLLFSFELLQPMRDIGYMLRGRQIRGSEVGFLVLHLCRVSRNCPRKFVVVVLCGQHTNE